MLCVKRVFLFGSIASITFSILLHLMTQLSLNQANAAPSGSSAACYVHDGSVIHSSADEQALQQAIDAASDGALLKIAGNCRGTHTREGVTQTAYISKSITLQGGYTLTNWIFPDPATHPTVLDAQNGGRVMYITGPVQVTLDSLSLNNGQVIDGNGGNIYHNATFIESGSGIYQLSVLTVSNSTIANGTATANGFAFPNGFGGGIAMAEGQLHLDNSLITGSHAAAGGGLAIFLGDTTIQNSSIISNRATEAGGGIILGYGTLTMTGSTVAFNHAELDGGGIENDVDSVVTLVNSTVSGNTAVRDGGGLDNFNNATATLVNTTFSHNTAGQNGGGVYNSAVITLSNSIIGNSGGGDCHQLGSAANFNDNGFNLIEDGSCGMAVGGDPLLGPLADNGGSSWTHSLLEGSPALDAGNCANGTNLVDQRGVSRPQATACDIGAFEREQPILFLPVILNSSN